MKSPSVNLVVVRCVSGGQFSRVEFYHTWERGNKYICVCTKLLSRVDNASLIINDNDDDDLFIFWPVIDIVSLLQTQTCSSHLWRCQMMGNHPSGPPPCLFLAGARQFHNSDDIFVTLHTHSNHQLWSQHKDQDIKNRYTKMAMGRLKVSI